jgi:hypothetical protein
MLNSPVFRGKFTPTDFSTLINNLSRISQRLRRITVRPFGRKFRRAAFSLERAVANIRRKRLKLAEINIQSAIKNIPPIPKDKQDTDPAQ